MTRRNSDLHLLQLTGEEQRSAEDKRWIYIWISLIPLIGLSAAYAAQIRMSQSVQDPYIVYGFPVVAALLMASILWNLSGGHGRSVGYLAVLIVSLVALAHNVTFVLRPNFPELPLYVNTGSYWTLATNAGFILTFLRLRPAVILITGLFAVVVALPWLLNPAGFTPFVGPLLRAQAMLLTLLMIMGCLAWYRARFTERAVEALMLRELTLTTLFAPVSADSTGATGIGDWSPEPALSGTQQASSAREGAQAPIRVVP